MGREGREEGNRVRTGGREDGVSETYSERLDHTCVCVCGKHLYWTHSLSSLFTFVAGE